MTTSDQYQIVTGTQQPVLEDTQPIPWIPHGWISFIHGFLYTNTCKIWLQSPWTPTPWRVCNQCLMQDIWSIISHEQLETINSVRMYLHIFMLSDITESNGCELLPSMLDGSALPVKSHLSWPYQPRPSKAAWNMWAKTLRTLYTTATSTHTLHLPLGKWIPHDSLQHESELYACPHTLDLYQNMAQNGTNTKSNTNDDAMLYIASRPMKGHKNSPQQQPQLHRLKILKATQ